MEFSEMYFTIVIQIILLLFSEKGNSSDLLVTKHLPILNGTLASISNPSPTKPTSQGDCLRIECKFSCSNGNHATIESDVNAVEHNECEFISELHLFNYQFPNKTLPKRLLTSISDNVIYLSIYSSDVEHIDAGAFESKTLTGVHLESLKLKFLEKKIFINVNEKFTSFTLIQSSFEINHVNESFLEHIKYQIKKLTIQTGLMEVKNITDSQYLLNSLVEVDLSYNNFEGRLLAKSFNQLSVVEKLNLAHSAITYLPESIFMDIVNTLKVLDLSNNKLVVVGRNIFGWRKFTKELTIYLNGNPWECTCNLQKELTIMLAFQQESVYCRTPDNILVTNETLCPFSISSTSTTGYTNPSNGTEGISNNKVISTETIQTTEKFLPPSSSESNTYDKTHELECHKDNEKLETENLSIYWPSSQFDIIRKKLSEVDIVVTTNLNETYGVLWFSKVTLQYYKMETNHNEYGLGCYGRLERITTVKNLSPDMSYTFCLILKDQLTISPFSCKSVHIDGNLDITYNAWLTTNMKATGISIMVIGIVLFKFFGIFLVFLVLKQKPSLLKGSKRVATQRSDTSNIIVFPEDKTLQKFKLMEEQLAIRKSRGLPFQRLSSVSLNSLESIQSYMNPENLNLYEIIPAQRTSIDNRYAEVPFKRKRSSNDPLPEIPQKVHENKSPYFVKKIELRVDQFREKETSIYF